MVSMCAHGVLSEMRIRNLNPSMGFAQARICWLQSHSALSVLRAGSNRHLQGGQRLTGAARLSSTVSQLLYSDPASTSSTAPKLLTVKGFVRSIRKQKRVSFAAISDGSSLGALQVVLTPEQSKKISLGAAVSVTGHWQPSPNGKEQSHELQAHSVEVLGDNDSASYPIQKKYHTLDYLRTLPHLRSRVPFNTLLLRLRSQVIGQATSFFANEGFIQTHPPVITSSDCEGAGEVFAVGTQPHSKSHKSNHRLRSMKPSEFFRSSKYLTVSSQLHLEALAQSVGRVWTLSPTFRAERSDTPRHLSEFYMLEAELCFVEDVNEVMDVVESLLQGIANQLDQSRLGEEILSAWSNQSRDPDSKLTQHDIKRRWNGLIRKNWPRITYTDAILSLQNAMSRREVNFECSPELGSGLLAEHEKYLAETIGNYGPVFVTDYPRAIKAFYMAPSTINVDSDRSMPSVACFDLLIPDLCELVGGSLREHRLGPLLDAMNSRDVVGRTDGDTASPDASGAVMRRSVVTQDDADAATQASLEWYADLRRYGSVPHGGFGIGFDRLLCYLSGVSNIRDVVSFPRWYGRCDC